MVCFILQLVVHHSAKPGQDLLSGTCRQELITYSEATEEYCFIGLLLVEKIYQNYLCHILNCKSVVSGHMRLNNQL